jgi:hypothetical protein
MCINQHRPGCQGTTSRARWPHTLARVYGPIMLILALALRPASGEAPEDQYLRVYGVIEQGDALQGKGQADQALARYREAQAALQAFEKDHRDWNPKLVAFRFRYLAEKIASLTAQQPAPAQTNAAAGAADTAAGAKAVASKSEEQTRMIDAGAEPRKELRLHPKAGDKQTGTFTLKSTMETAMSGAPNQVIKIPTMKLTYEAAVKSVSEQGDIDYEVVIKAAEVIEEPGVLPQALEVMKSALDGMKDLSGTGTLSSRGLNKGFEFKIPGTAPVRTRQLVEQMKGAFKNLSASLPQEALGMGAKWEVKSANKSQGATVEETVIYQLASMEGEHVTVKATVAQSAANQKIESDQMPGLKLKLNKLVGKGTGSNTFDLAQLLPSERTAELHTENYLSMDAGGQTQALTTKQDVNLRFEAK